jgi:serine/threonine protein kinase
VLIHFAKCRRIGLRDLSIRGLARSADAIMERVADGRLQESPMVEPVPPVSLPAVLQGRYRMGAVLGRGGASVVYRARDLLLGRDVAVKVFTARAVDPRDLRLQEGEARLLGGLNHPALVTLLDAGVDTTDLTAPQAFLIMEFVDGPDLRERLRSGALSPLEVCYLGWDLLGGLGYVHEHGIIHRDLKPANVLLAAARDRPARGKLADFGIAVLRGHLEEPEGETTGTAAYLSPEQVEGLPLTTGTDIYSLGLVLLEAATARTAFPGGVVDSALARLDRDPAIPSDVPHEIATILRAMTQRDPAARPSAGDAAAAFREVIVGELGGQRPQVRDPESERLAAVRDYNLVGTPPDAEFDRITALAARMFDVPVAVISIVDEKRVWLKSHQGLDAQEVARADGLGATGSLHDETLIIEDVTGDPRTAHLPSAQESPFRFYAGVPLITASGFNLGTFAIAGTSPRRMSATEIASLEDLAAMVLHEIELRRAARRMARLG